MTDTSYLAETAGAYDAVATQYAEFVKGMLERLPLDRAMISAFAEYVRTREAGPVLDAGCGPGYLTALLRAEGLDASGVDLSAAMVDLARRAHPGVRFEIGSIDALDTPDGGLAGIMAWYSLIHVPPRELGRYFGEFRRTLAAGGYLLLGFFESAGEPVTAFDHKVTTAYRWPIDDLAGLAGDAGFLEVGRVLREPVPGERFRHGHLLLRAG
ncbi:class I SAM-dependent methyltransferase [Sphaerisporangium aureirubrum]|uniref:Class I SAM-dependent methyltransferase n=1 Tax=Sphaerisporangium aureirubrum TaxID=1544736 RepID=A0ABW1NJL4_9ACTN